MKSLSVYLNSLDKKYSATDKKWVTYVKDHKSWLLRNSNLIPVDVKTIYNDRYSPESFIEKLNIDQSSTWIILWLNKLKSVFDFENITKLYIPNNESLELLKNEYDAYIDRINST